MEDARDIFFSVGAIVGFDCLAKIVSFDIRRGCRKAGKYVVFVMIFIENSCKSGSIRSRAFAPVGPWRAGLRSEPASLVPLRAQWSESVPVRIDPLLQRHFSTMQQKRNTFPLFKFTKRGYT
jgi:hypothetical protein